MDESMITNTNDEDKNGKGRENKRNLALSIPISKKIWIKYWITVDIDIY